jgi:hypothetical protein
VQIHPRLTQVDRARVQRLKLNCDEALSNFPFDFIFRHFMLEAPPPSSAVAALLLTKLKQHAAAEWPRAAPAAAEAESGVAGPSPFASPALLSLVEGQMARALDASRGGSGGAVGWSAGDHNRPLFITT